jgi:hypothetical protein
MKLTIIRDDATVYKDGEGISGLDVSYVPSNVHALQWNGVKGWVEFCMDDNFFKPENQIIDELPTWAETAAQQWDTVKAVQLAAQLAPSDQVVPFYM